MQTYFNTITGKSATRLVLDLQGAPKTDEQLAWAGIYPIEYEYPEYDSLYQQIIPAPLLDQSEERGVFVQTFAVEPLPDEQAQRNLDEYAKERAALAMELADQAMSDYLNSYSAVEKLTFPEQRLEALAYQQNQAAATPMLDKLAAERGIPRPDMIAKTLAKVQEFDERSAIIVGKQQAYEDSIQSIAADATQSFAKRVTALREMQFNY